MDLSKLVAITGKSGVYKMISNKSNGLIVQNLENNKKGFVSARQYQFTPLESISIYTNDPDEGAELKTVFEHMQKLGSELPPSKASADELREYFTKVLPTHDQERVHISDIKKIVKWYTFLDKQDMLVGDDSEEDTAGDEEE